VSAVLAAFGWAFLLMLAALLVALATGVVTITVTRGGDE